MESQLPWKVVPGKVSRIMNKQSHIHAQFPCWSKVGLHPQGDDADTLPGMVSQPHPSSRLHHLEGYRGKDRDHFLLLSCAIMK